MKLNKIVICLFAVSFCTSLMAQSVSFIVANQEDTYSTIVTNPIKVYASTLYLPQIRFSISVDRDTTLYYSLRFGNNKEEKIISPEPIVIKKGYNLTQIELSNDVKALFNKTGLVTITGVYNLYKTGEQRDPENDKLFENSIKVRLYDPISCDEGTKNFEIVSGYGKATLRVKANGGDTTRWEYQWYQGSQLDNETNDSLVLEPNDDIDKKQEKTYSVKITNKAEDGEVIYFENVRGYVVTVYPKVDVTYESDKNEVVFNYNDTINTKVKRIGGAEADDGATWDYKWYVGDEKNAKPFDINEEFSYIPSSDPSSDPIDDYEPQNIIIVAKNTKGGTTLYEGKKEVQIKVYKGVKLGKIQANNDGKAVYGYNKNHIKLTFNHPTGGVSTEEGGEWIYEWYKDDSPISKISENTYTVNPNDFNEPEGDQPLEVRYFVRVTNKKNDNVMYQGKTDSITVRIYPRVELTPKPDKTEVVKGYEDEIDFKFDVKGGVKVEDGATWDCKWSVEGEKIPNSFDITKGFKYQPSSNPTSAVEEKKILIVTKNTLHGATLYEETRQVIIRIYKEVDLGEIQANNDGKAVYGYNKNHIKLTFNHPTGGVSTEDGGEWIYEWYEDDSQIRNNEENSYTMHPDDFDEPYGDDVRKVRYFVRVKNIKDGNVMYDNTTETKTVEIYPRVTLTLNAEKTEVIKGYKDEIEFTLNVHGGVTNGKWVYRWYRDNKQIPGANEESYNGHPIENDIEDKTIVRYYVQVINGDENSPYYEGFSDTIQITVNPEMMLTFESDGSSATNLEVIKGYKDNLLLSWNLVSKTSLEDGKVTYTLKQGDKLIKEYTKPDSYNFEPVDPGEKSKTEIMTLSCVYKKQNNVIFNESKNIEITVYPKVTIKPIEGRRHIVLDSGDYDNVTYTLNKTGGPEEEDRWNYEWFLGDNPKGKESSYSYKPTSVSDSSLYVKVECLDREGKVIYEETTDPYDIHVYPAVNITIECKDSNGDYINEKNNYVMSEDLISLLLHHQGGIDDDKNWKCSWKEVINGAESNKEDSIVYTFAPVNNESGKTIKQTFRAKVVLVQGNDILYEGTTKDFDIKIVKKPTIDPALVVEPQDSTDIYTDVIQHCYISADTHDGYESGWTYSCFLNGSQIGITQNKNQFEIEFPQVSEKEVRSYYIQAINKIRNKEYLNEITDSRIFTLWPEVKFGKQLTANSYLRDGDTLTISVPVTGGYTPQGIPTWKYILEYGDSKLEETTSDSVWMTIPSVSFTGENKATKSVEYILTVSNLGPYGNIWGGKKSYQHKVQIYKQPKTPKKLQIKGSGASHTLIVDHMLPDQDNILKDYQYVFGYTDAQGEPHDFDPTRERYFQVPNENWDENANYYVYALWNYEDGAKVTSQKRIINGKEEYFNGCDFKAVETRASEDDPTDFNTIKCNGLQAQGAHLRANFNSPTSGMVSIITLDGRVVREQIFPKKKNHDEIVNTSNLSTGIYLFKYMFGIESATEKVIIK